MIFLNKHSAELCSVELRSVELHWEELRSVELHSTDLPSNSNLHSHITISGGKKTFKKGVTGMKVWV